MIISAITFGCDTQKPAPLASVPEATAPAPVVPTETTTGLGGRVWEVLELDGTAPALPVDARRLTIQFDPAKLGVSGFAGCNTFQGSYKINGDVIHLGPFAVTRMACQATSEVENSFLRAIAKTTSHRVDADSLEFLGADGAVLLSFKPQRS